MIEILNKRNKNIQTFTDVRTATVTVNIKKGCISFNSATVEIAGLHLGKYVHLVKMNKVWGFIVNDDNTGYKLWQPDKKGGYMTISSMPLLRYMSKELGIKELTRYYVQATATEQCGKPFFEILVTMPLKAFSN